MRRDKPARCEGVQVSPSEGLANHAGPESCPRRGNGPRAAWPGERAGRVWSPAIGQSGCRRAPHPRKATASTPLRRGGDGPGGVGDPWHAWKHRGRDPGDPASDLVHRRKVRTVNRQGSARDARTQGVGQLRSPWEAAEPRDQAPCTTLRPRRTRWRSWREGSGPRGRRWSTTGAGRRAGLACTGRSTADDRPRGAVDGALAPCL
jgi:hypothetical protein